MIRQRAGATPRVRWRECAARLAEAVPCERLHPAVIRWTQESPGATKWSVAFSGGADSLCLLLLLWAHWPRRRRRLQALHFDHRLRGAASRRDAAFCRRVCRSLGIRLVQDAWRDAPARPSEGAARTARHEFFDRHARVLWLGHQQDDVAESMLMRLARGSGSGGLAAPRPVHVFTDGRVRLRPLLSLSKAEIVGALRGAGAGWCEDETNSGTAYFRNRVRRSVLPAWQKAAGRDVLAGVALSRERLDDDDLALEAWASSVRAIRKDGSLRLSGVSGKPRALVRRVLHRWLAGRSTRADLSRQAFDALLDAVMLAKDTRQSIGSGEFAVIRKRRLFAMRAAKIQS